MKLTTTSLFALVICASATVLANENEERNALSNAKVLLTEAIEIAIKETAGNAISAELEDENGKYIYSVEIITSDNKELEIEIDSTTGEIIKVEEDD